MDILEVIALAKWQDRSATEVVDSARAMAATGRHREAIDLLSSQPVESLDIAERPSRSRAMAPRRVRAGARPAWLAAAVRRPLSRRRCAAGDTGGGPHRGDSRRRHPAPRGPDRARPYHPREQTGPSRTGGAGKRSKRPQPRVGRERSWRRSQPPGIPATPSVTRGGNTSPGPRVGRGRRRGPYRRFAAGPVGLHHLPEEPWRHRGH